MHIPALTVQFPPSVSTRLAAIFSARYALLKVGPSAAQIGPVEDLLHHVSGPPPYPLINFHLSVPSVLRHD
jgi:hypothetical protein